MLTGWNDTAAPVPAVTVPELFAAQAAAAPDAVAVACGDACVTYAGLDAAGGPAGAGWRRPGAGPEPVVGVCLERGGGAGHRAAGGAEGRGGVPAGGPGLPGRADRVHARRAAVPAAGRDRRQAARRAGRPGARCWCWPAPDGRGDAGRPPVLAGGRAGGRVSGVRDLSPRGRPGRPRGWRCRTGRWCRRWRGGRFAGRGRGCGCCSSRRSASTRRRVEMWGAAGGRGRRWWWRRRGPAGGELAVGWVRVADCGSASGAVAACRCWRPVRGAAGCAAAGRGRGAGGADAGGAGWRRRAGGWSTATGRRRPP